MRDQGAVSFWIISILFATNIEPRNRVLRLTVAFSRSATRGEADTLWCAVHFSALARLRPRSSYISD
jgi:hypothetical protein